MPAIKDISKPSPRVRSMLDQLKPIATQGWFTKEEQQPVTKKRNCADEDLSPPPSKRWRPNCDPDILRQLWPNDEYEDEEGEAREGMLSSISALTVPDTKETKIEPKERGYRLVPSKNASSMLARMYESESESENEDEDEAREEMLAAVSALTVPVMMEMKTKPVEREYHLVPSTSSKSMLARAYESEDEDEEMEDWEDVLDEVVFKQEGMESAGRLKAGVEAKSEEMVWWMRFPGEGSECKVDVLRLEDIARSALVALADMEMARGALDALADMAPVSM